MNLVWTLKWIRFKFRGLYYRKDSPTPTLKAITALNTVKFSTSWDSRKIKVYLNSSTKFLTKWNSPLLCKSFSKNLSCLTTISTNLNKTKWIFREKVWLLGTSEGSLNKYSTLSMTTSSLHSLSRILNHSNQDFVCSMTRILFHLQRISIFNLWSMLSVNGNSQIWEKHRLLSSE
jgi:hypothetical protein